MPEIEIDELVSRIHASPTRLVVAITGGGSRAVSLLLEQPGGSRTLLEAVVPYSAAALAEWLGARPEHACAPRTSRAMAMVAYQRAIRLSAANDEFDTFDLAGIGCTASVSSDRPKRGPHRIHVALQTASLTATTSLVLQKGRRDRRQEEELAARMVLNQIAEACGLTDQLSLELSNEAGEGGQIEQVERSRTIALESWRGMLAGRVRSMHVNGTHSPPGAAHRVVYPGAFHPLHAGHRRIAQIAAERLGVPVEFEISIDNVDKPPLDFTEMQERLAQFSATEAVWFTRAASFEEKSRLFAGATFLVGVDTIERIADPRYYGYDPAAVEAAVRQIGRQGCRFLVFGRVLRDEFKVLSQLDLPKPLAELCEEVTAEQFREDISSTQLRGEQELGAADGL